MKNRKGSTLLMTLLIFVVLMIFGTFILNFMVTENKQSKNHQHKTQAYYIARSGAVAVEAAIMEVYDTDNGISLDKNISEEGTKIAIDGIDANVWVEKKTVGEEIIGEDNKIIQEYDYIIKSEGKSNDVKEVVEKVISVKSIKTTESVIKVDNAMTYLKKDKVSKILTSDHKSKLFNAQYDDKNKYPLHEFEDFAKMEEFTRISSSQIGPELNGGNYILDTEDLILSGKNITIARGEVNIHVKNSISLINTGIECINSSKLNFYIYGEQIPTDKYTLKLGQKNDQRNLHANFFVKKGNVRFKYLKTNFEGNIVSNGEVVDLHSHANGKDKVNIKGLIYAPNATINFGKINEEWAAISILGAVVGSELWYNGKEKQIENKFKVSGDLGGIDMPFEDKVTTTITKNPGYFK